MLPEVEISLSRRDEASYSVTLRLRADQFDRRAEEYPVRFDFPRLAGLALDPAEYGRLLSQTLFTGAVRELWDDVRRDFAAPGEDGAGPQPMRLRLWIDRWSFPLHRLRWETLRDPETDRSLVTDMKIWFSRHLSSPEKIPIRLRLRREKLRAVVAVASPVDLAELGKNLAPIDVTAVLAQARAGLQHIEKLTELPQVTLARLADTLRGEDYDLLSLVCHGAIYNDEPRLLLVDDDGRAKVTSGDQLMEVLARLLHVPRLVLLASCQSAGQARAPRGEEDASLVAIGPRLAEVGVPAVLAMHGNVLQETLRRFMERFFTELLDPRHDGLIDRAVTEAREAIEGQPDAWAPVLYSRLVEGRLWNRGAFTSRDPTFTGWEGVIKQLRSKRCVPVLGSGLLDHVVGTPQQLARRWAESSGYPLARHDFNDLTRVAQYLETTQGGIVLRGQYVEELIAELLRRWPALAADAGHRTDEEPEAYLLRLFEAVRPLLRLRNPAEPHDVLARLGCPLYLTTNPDNLLALALQEHLGRPPREEMCPWHEDRPTPAAAPAAYVAPSAAQPLVYRLFGSLSDTTSLVLTEEDYFSYLTGVAGINAQAQPSAINKALMQSGLLFLGFRLDDWDFRAFYHFLINRGAWQSRARWKPLDVAVQLNPDDTYIDPPQARRFLEHRFQNSNINIYWGSVEDFLQELNDRW